MNRALQFDYVSVGHVTVDVLEDETRRPGGTALYAALQAARLGLRSLILTRGVPSEIEALLEPWAGEIELRVQPAAETTTFATRGLGADRSQRLLSWAGPIERGPGVACAVMHLAPVAAELPDPWPAGGRLLGLTPQGLARRWPTEGGVVRASAPPPEALAQASRADAIVLSQHERGVCGELIEGALAGGALLAVTAGEEPCTILLPGAEPIVLPVRRVVDPADDLGAGDVFAAAFFTGLAEGRTPPQAGTLANAAAALRMTGVGPEAIARRAQIEAGIAPAV